ncbi:unnamed protein product [Rhizoctonia solani]|uniref:Uncharacterized protein n=1 Tax=Rhizoctonia solani TaxID=456999 RepID=A0A8H2XSM1_9AGAM|nr:unnamed protein product [Rhizoctonia solani]
MLFRAPRRPCWEVVDHKEVKPTPVYYDQEDLQILKIHDSDIAGQYEFEMRSDFRCRQALEAARLELLHQIKKDHCNVLLVEGWKLTKLRRGREMRIRVHYHGKLYPHLCSDLATHMILLGRPARAVGNVSRRYPPFIEVLEFN